MPLKDIQTQPGLFLGPGFAASFVEAIEAGIILSQFSTFHSRWNNESRLIKVLAIFVTTVAIFQTSAALWNVWHIYVQNFGNWVLALEFAWPDRLQSIINFLMAAPSQMFFMWRCWRLTNKNYYILFPMILLLIGTLITSIVVCVKIYNVDFAIFIAASAKLSPLPLNVEFICSLVFSTALDLFITVILLERIIRGRSNVVSRRFRKVLNRFIHLTWASAIPPSLCATATVITYVISSLRPIYFVDLGFLAILGKLYVISLFVMLNSREDLRREELGLSLSPATGMDSLPRVGGHTSNQNRTPSQVITTFSINLTTEKDGQISEVPSTPC